MTEQHSVLPFCAYAFAMQPVVRDRLLTLYNARRAKCFAAAMRTNDRNAPILRTGRAEHKVTALQILGLITYAVDEQDELLIRQIARAAHSEAYESISRDSRILHTNEVAKWLGKQDSVSDSEFLWRVYSVFFVSLVLHVPQNEHIERYVREHMEHVITTRRETPWPEAGATPRAKELIKTFGRIDVDMLYGSIAEYFCVDRDKYEHLFLMANSLGIDLEDYCSGIELSLSETALCLTNDEDHIREIEACVLSCVLKAARADRDFCLKLYNADKSVHLEAVTIERDQLAQKLRAAESRAAVLETELNAQRANTAPVASDEVQALRQEISALRSALYDSSAGVDYQPIQTAKREIPERIISIGGHDEWCRRMRELAPGVTFIPASVTIPQKVVRGASELWVQPNYIGHKNFTPCADEARSCGIPIYYYPSTGIDRCIAALKEKRY